jgi:hypothetical protein
LTTLMDSPVTVPAPGATQDVVPVAPTAFGHRLAALVGTAVQGFVPNIWNVHRALARSPLVLAGLATVRAHRPPSARSRSRGLT